MVDGRPIRVIRKKNKYFLSIVPTPRLKITGRVQDGFLHQGVPGLKVSLCRADSTVMQDSTPMTTFYYKEGVIQPQIYGTVFRAQDRQYLIHTQAPGYGDIWKKVRTEEQEDGEINVPIISMLRVIELKEVNVVATKIKMYWKGDTLVYDATAFKLPDGSMLDALIAQLPGVEMKDNGEIYVNGRKVDELLLGARSFMRGNRKVLLENLPYYTVKHIKVYDKASDMDEALGRTDGPKRYVMDVNLKEEYQVGHIGNVEAAGGTGKRWLGRGFLLGFTKLWRYSLVANANNVNESRHIEGTNHWTPASMPTSMMTKKSTAAEFYYHAKENAVTNSTNIDYSSNDETQEMSRRYEQFLQGRTPLTLTTSSNKSNYKQMKISNEFGLNKGIYLRWNTEFDYTTRNASSASSLEQWDDSLLTAAQHTTGKSGVKKSLCCIHTSAQPLM